ncbi:hypothetical protein [Thermomonas sp.]|uniref:hypothetical protein n=1 Tax=Thermomonas sp. TaxID=1971895 RepID=UPI00261EF8E6|nr:hypothetical protein [Thermomonas sp.]
MKQTVISLVTPHVLTVVDLAKLSETGANVDWHVRDAVAKAYAELGHLYNARDLISAYIEGLESTARDVGPGHRVYAGTLKSAATLAAQRLKELD